MQKLSLTVLLRFLSRFSQWNLVRESDKFHLYFPVGGGDGRQSVERVRRRGKQRARPHYPCRGRAGGGERRKDVFVFNPMFQTAEDGVRVGLDGAADLKASKRSSVTSLAWDDSDFLQYRESGAESRASTITDSDREATPTGDWADPPTGESVRMQGDRLLREMLSLRREIEEFREPAAVGETSPALQHADTGTQGEAGLDRYERREESVLRERLEQMTLQIKREMEEETERQRNRQLEHSSQQEDTKVKKFFKKLLENETHSAKNIYSKEKSNSKEKDALNAAIMKLLEPNEEPETFEEAEKEKIQSLLHGKIQKQRSSSRKGDNNKKQRRSKDPPADPASQKVEIPFCSHSCVQAAGNPEEAVMEKTKKVTKEEENTKIVLTPDEQLAAEDILRQLVDIKQSNRGEPNPVLDTMISVIQLSSTSLALPAPASTGSGVQFKELFNFEVNFSESREAFSKLAGSGADTVVSLQELFPWTLTHPATEPCSELREPGPSLPPR